MRFEKFSFGSICIDGVVYKKDVVIEGGAVRKRKTLIPKSMGDRSGRPPMK